MSGTVRTPTIFQMEAAECGAASLAMILAYYGKRVPLEKIRIDAGVSRDGSKAGNLIRAAAKYGLEGHGYKKTFDALSKMKPPCIILLNYGHFVVFEGIRRHQAYLNDPALGRRQIPERELAEQFAGVALTFAPTEAFQKERSKTTVGAAVRERMRGYYPDYALTLIIALMSAVVCAGVAVVIQIYTDVGAADIPGNGMRQERLTLLRDMILLLMAALELGLLRLQSVLYARLHRRIALPSARRFVGQLLRLPLNFYEQRYPGELVGRLDKNHAADDFVSDRLPRALFGMISSLVYLVVMCRYIPSLGAAAVLCFAIQIGAIIALSKAVNTESAGLRADDSRLSGKLYAGLRIIDTLKASGAERDYPRQLERRVDRQLRSQRRMARAGQLSGALRYLFFALFAAIGIWMMSARLVRMGQLIAFLLLFIAFFAPVDTIAPMIAHLGAIRADLAAAQDVLRYERDTIYDAPAEDQAGKLQGEIILRHIDFAYSSLTEPLIRNLSLKIEPGSMVAIVGATGSGKSTVAKLISGLYRPQRGDIRLDGVKLPLIPRNVINASLSTVSQNIALFSGSVRDNITMWNTRISDEDIRAAAQDACLYDLIRSKPDGFETMIAENGANLSGGQRQRMEIARALATNPSILIMDEATSALDPITEENVIRNIRRRGCTCVMIAHRLSAVRDCDTIIVMDQGAVVERGTHAELIARGGLYCELAENK